MIHVQLALDELGQVAGATKGTASCHHMLRDLWQGFVSEGLVTQVCVTVSHVYHVMWSLLCNLGKQFWLCVCSRHVGIRLLNHKTRQYVAFSSL